tara:strand:- start:127 stop:384 length:258 start_codon:yes stop_codon:yes gene_type:complete
LGFNKRNESFLDCVHIFAIKLLDGFIQSNCEFYELGVIIEVDILLKKFFVSFSIKLFVVFPIIFVLWVLLGLLILKIRVLFVLIV